MAKRSRRVKTDYTSKGYKHREHRSKKNRVNRSAQEWTAHREKKRKLEKIKLDETEQDMLRYGGNS